MYNFITTTITLYIKRINMGTVNPIEYGLQKHAYHFTTV